MLSLSYSGSRVLVDGVKTIAVALSGVDVAKGRLPQNRSNLSAGNLQTYIQHIAEQWTSDGDWILEFEPVN